MRGGFLVTEPFIAEPMMIESAGDMRRIHAANSSALPSARSDTPEFAAEPLADVSFPARTKAEALQRTVEYFRHHPQASVAEVAESVGRSESTVRSYLVELESENRIERNEDGVQVHLAHDERG
jgi:predicted transcriptional regulator